MLAGCKKDLTSVNIDPVNPSSVPSYALFSSAQKSLARTMSSANVNVNIFRLIEQQWTETTYNDESNYDLATRQIPRGVWNALYRDVLRDLKETRDLIPTDVLDPATQKPDLAKQKNELAIVDIMEVYAWYYLVTTYGNIPYSEALNIDKPFPKYDAQSAVFTSLLSRINQDITNLNPANASFGDEDIIYAGDLASWKKFATTLKLKIGMTLADVDATLAKTVVESAVASGVFTSESDNAVFQFLSGPPNTNPVWEDLVQSGRKDFVITSTLVDTLLSLSDPRIPLFFTFDNSGTGYSGGVPGDQNNFQAFSKPSAILTAADYPLILLSFVETEFLLAEAKERGFNVPGTAASHYTNGVTQSIISWGGKALDALTYLAQPQVNYLTAAGTYKQKIGFQKWIALYNRGWDAWIETRRLDYPQLPDPIQAVSDFPVRFTYSVDEQNINTTNYNAAAAAIGGDKVTTKLFWDKF